jgi:hypothetical protein
LRALALLGAGEPRDLELHHPPRQRSERAPEKVGAPLNEHLAKHIVEVHTPRVGNGFLSSRRAGSFLVREEHKIGATMADTHASNFS